MWASRQVGRAVLGVLVATAALACSACGDGSSSSGAGSDTGSPASPATGQPGASSRAPLPETSPAAAPASVLPRELVGTWISTDQGAAELIYVFSADGTYKHAGVLLQQRDTGLFSYKIAARGTVRTEGRMLVLRQRSGTQSLRDPDSPASNFDKAVRSAVERYTWATQGRRLQLTDQEVGEPIEFRRQ